jgi:hypothetical protein
MIVRTRDSPTRRENVLYSEPNRKTASRSSETPTVSSSGRQPLHWAASRSTAIDVVGGGRPRRSLEYEDDDIDLGGDDAGLIFERHRFAADNAELHRAASTPPAPSST